MAASANKRPAATTKNGTASRRQEILTCASNVFASKGFASATVRDVADAAGILSGSLYHHFESKDRMLEEILRPALESLVAEYKAVTGSPPDAMRKLFDAAFLHIVRQPSANAILQNDYSYLSSIDAFSFVVEFNRAVRSIWIDTLQRGVADGSFHPDLDLRVAYQTMMGAIASSVRWSRPGNAKAAQKTSAAMAHLFLTGILTD